MSAARGTLGPMPPRARSSGRAGRPSGPTWETVEPAPVVLVTGAESLLAERAVERVVAQVRAADPGAEVTRLDAAAYESGRLRVLASPSLFGEARVVVLEALHTATDDCFADVAEYVRAPEEDVTLVLQHGGGVRGKRTLDAVRGAGAVVVACEPVKKDADKAAFVTAEIRAARRRVDESGVRALIEACGNDLRELAAACRQLVSDTSGVITAETVARYHGGRVEATGFRVADAAVAGRAGEAVAMLRHALATGTDPVPLVAALAAKLRTLAKVGAARGRGMDPARDLGLAPWQVDRARRELAGWTPEGLAAAVAAVARADAEVKGAGRDPVFAVERAVLAVASARG